MAENKLPNANNLTLDEYNKELNINVMSIENCTIARIMNQSTEDYTNIVQVYKDSNILCLEHAPVLTKITIIKASVLSILAALSFFGNIITLISVRRGNQNRGRSRPSCTAIYRLIFHLTIADLFVTVFCLAGEAAWSLSVQWYAGNVACKVFKFLQMFALHLSTFILVLIGVDRWLAVKYPMKSLATASRSSKFIFIAWILSFILSVPQAIIFRVARGPFVEEFYQCVTHGFYTARWQEQIYTTLSFTFMFVIPLIILISTYISTVRTIEGSKRIFEIGCKRQDITTLDINRTRLIDRAKIKSLKMSIIIVAAFVIWWTPYYIMMILFTFWNPEKILGENLLSGIFFFGMSNSLVNPVIYGAFHLWPKKKRSSQSDKESGEQHASFLRRCDQYSSVKQTTLRSIRSSTKNSNGQNVTFL
ncbi:PREDICTED: gonadotropin-releasing hormone receptor [Papilio polytes]|uniref:gonadotropin-releasing hormone receptor n=1 Tax=Papilio polytes TaxID=76194 RepID=UPI000676004A|nr:PREDICTED: gonadotropin-releasing hormone receptor [Papilio polytes]